MELVVALYSFDSSGGFKVACRSTSVATRPRFPMRATILHSWYVQLCILKVTNRPLKCTENSLLNLVSANKVN